MLIFRKNFIINKIKMVLPPCTDQGISPYQGLVIHLTTGAFGTNRVILRIAHFFQIIALIFLKYVLYLL